MATHASAAARSTRGRSRLRCRCWRFFCFQGGLVFSGGFAAGLFGGRNLGALGAADVETDHDGKKQGEKTHGSYSSDLRKGPGNEVFS